MVLENYLRFRIFWRQKSNHLQSIDMGLPSLKTNMWTTYLRNQSCCLAFTFSIYLFFLFLSPFVWGFFDFSSLFKWIEKLTSKNKTSIITTKFIVSFAVVSKNMLYKECALFAIQGLLMVFVFILCTTTSSKYIFLKLLCTLIIIFKSIINITNLFYENVSSKLIFLYIWNIFLITCKIVTTLQKICKILINSIEYIINLDHIKNCEIVVNLIDELTTILNVN